jgi:SAM-dependent methyltransferase
MGFVDHFGDVSASYASARPGYPAALFDWLAQLAPRRRLAWDCACGSGQASRPLAGRFDRVIATDASLALVARSMGAPRLGLVAAEAGAAPIVGGAVDLITVGQALHWFAGEPFWAEVRRVAAPGALLAAWTYALPILGGELEAAMLRFYSGPLGAWWPAERRLVMEGYRSLELPFCELPAPRFEMVADWDLARFLAFLRSWSATARFVRAEGYDPVAGVEDELASLWGPPGEIRRVAWPLTVRAARL